MESRVSKISTYIRGSYRGNPFRGFCVTYLSGSFVRQQAGYEAEFLGDLEGEVEHLGESQQPLVKLLRVLLPQLGRVLVVKPTILKTVSYISVTPTF